MSHKPGAFGIPRTTGKQNGVYEDSATFLGEPILFYSTWTWKSISPIDHRGMLNKSCHVLDTVCGLLYESPSVCLFPEKDHCHCRSYQLPQCCTRNSGKYWPFLLTLPASQPKNLV